jgi:hypothetical protein
MNEWLIILCAVLYLSITSVQARDFRIKGAGAESCGTWVAEIGTNPGARENHQWVLGYVTAFNRFGLGTDADVSKGADPPGLIAWIDNYCRTHPLDTVETGAARLIDELQQRTGAR